MIPFDDREVVREILTRRHATAEQPLTGRRPVGREELPMDYSARESGRGFWPERGARAGSEAKSRATTEGC